MSLSPTGRTRLDWVDYAKGICIFFVVMLHVNDLVENHVHAVGWLDYVVQFARPFRMPDFFLIAGLFLPRVIERPWRHFVDSKILHFYYFYLLWMTTEFVLLDTRHILADGGGPAQLVRAYGAQLVNPSGSLWFIHILPVFFVVTRVTRNVPQWLVWAVAAALQMLQPHTGWVVVDQFAARYVYFYSGYALAGSVLSGAAWAGLHPAVSRGYLAAWAVLNAACVSAGWAALPGVSLALGYAGAMAIVVLAVQLSALRGTVALRFMGQHSLAIYLADYLVSVVVIRVFLPVLPDIGSVALISSVTTIALALMLWRTALRTPLRFLYVRPVLLRIPVRDTRAR